MNEFIITCHSCQAYELIQRSACYTLALSQYPQYPEIFVFCYSNPKLLFDKLEKVKYITTIHLVAVIKAFKISFFIFRKIETNAGNGGNG